MNLTKLVAAALLAVPLAGMGLPSTPASAMPMIDTAPATMAQSGSAVENVRWVCGPFGCVWRHRPHWRPYPVFGYGPRYGYHRWHRSWRGPVYGYHRWHGPYGYGRPHGGWHHGWHRG